MNVDSPEHAPSPDAQPIGAPAGPPASHLPPKARFTHTYKQVASPGSTAGGDSGPGASAAHAASATPPAPGAAAPAPASGPSAAAAAHLPDHEALDLDLDQHQHHQGPHPHLHSHPLVRLGKHGRLTDACVPPPFGGDGSSSSSSEDPDGAGGDADADGDGDGDACLDSDGGGAGLEGGELGAEDPLRRGRKALRLSHSKIQGTAEPRKPRIGPQYQAVVPPWPPGGR